MLYIFILWIKITRRKGGFMLLIGQAKSLPFLLWRRKYTKKPWSPETIPQQCQVMCKGPPGVRQASLDYSTHMG